MLNKREGSGGEKSERPKDGRRGLKKNKGQVSETSSLPPPAWLKQLSTSLF